MRAAISFCVAGAISFFVPLFPSWALSGHTQTAAAAQQNPANAAHSGATTGSDHPPASSLKKLAQDHKVITTDDLERLHSEEKKQHEFTKAGGKVSSDHASCDEDCADEARAEAGMGPDREGEWQAQLSAALHYLSGDATWRYAYSNGLQKAQMYCSLQEQLRKAPPPSGNDYRSRVERAKQEQYAHDMNHTLSVGLQGTSTQMNALIGDAQKTDPVRAAVMSVLARRIFNQCADLSYDP
ncbi:MAG TPA: hypothetical protein VGS59_14370 [Candidatus Acidoferrales bacterium]|nr:hypothetical protein [Candidatus Acidoferrales bacterium]